MIYIDIPFPHDCYLCPCWGLYFSEFRCNLLDKTLPLRGRLEDCPLKEEVHKENT